MKLYDKGYIKNLNKNLRKKQSYRNIFLIENNFQKPEIKLKRNKSDKNSRIQHNNIKNINIYNINNNINLNKQFPNIKSLSNINSLNAYKINYFRRKPLKSSFFEKIKNLYFSKSPTLLYETEDNINKKVFFNNKKNINDIIKNSYNNSLPKIIDKKKALLSHILNKKKIIENYSIKNKNEQMSNKLTLPHIKSSISYNNKNIKNNFLYKIKVLERCKSSLNISKYGVKSIYMSLNVNQKKDNKKFFRKNIFLKGMKRKKKFNSEKNINLYILSFPSIIFFYNNEYEYKGQKI
jgi:hypothetical protein